jgi:hypothetical protein
MVVSVVIHNDSSKSSFLSMLHLGVKIADPTGHHNKRREQTSFRVWVPDQRCAGILWICFVQHSHNASCWNPRSCQPKDNKSTTVPLPSSRNMKPMKHERMHRFYDCTIRDLCMLSKCHASQSCNRQHNSPQKNKNERIRSPV